MIETLCSPVNGRVTNLENVKDDMFSQKILGDGVALIPEQNEFMSPVDGIITVVYETKHAIGIRTSEKSEILIHIGIDTVYLKGEPFSTKIKVGDYVKKGDLLIVVDWQWLKDKGFDVIVPIIVMNKKIKLTNLENVVKIGDPLFEIE